MNGRREFAIVCHSNLGPDEHSEEKLEIHNKKWYAIISDNMTLAHCNAIILADKHTEMGFLIAEYKDKIIRIIE